MDTIVNKNEIESIFDLIHELIFSGKIILHMSDIVDQEDIKNTFKEFSGKRYMNTKYKLRFEIEGEQDIITDVLYKIVNNRNEIKI
jgi:hypothetical protein